MHGVVPYATFTLSARLGGLVYQAHQDLSNDISWIPRMEHTIFGLIKKRCEIAGQHKLA
jgi:hypothetical protein